jgi:hypothetical protein
VVGSIAPAGRVVIGNDGDVVAVSLDRFPWAASGGSDHRQRERIEGVGRWSSRRSSGRCGSIIAAGVIVSRALGSIARGCGVVIGTDGEVVAVSLDRFTWATLGRSVQIIASGNGSGAWGVGHRVAARGVAVRSSRRASSCRGRWAGSSRPVGIIGTDGAVVAFPSVPVAIRSRWWSID